MAFMESEKWHETLIHPFFQGKFSCHCSVITAQIGSFQQILHWKADKGNSCQSYCSFDKREGLTVMGRVHFDRFRKTTDNTIWAFSTSSLIHPTTGNCTLHPANHPFIPHHLQRKVFSPGLELRARAAPWMAGDETIWDALVSSSIYNLNKCRIENAGGWDMRQR